MRPLNAGELAMATPIESFTAVLLQLNMHYKTRVALKLTGIAESAAPVGGSTPATPAGADTPAKTPAAGGAGKRGKADDAQPS
jgi:hypothetical protein